MEDIDKLSINAIRFLSADAVQKANSGHPGAPMGLAPTAYVLYTKFLKHNPAHPQWPGRDRFVLSAGHASMLQYSLLHLCGYPVSMDDLKNFRQWKSATPGHPEYGDTPGVETTTGPLGQGFANAVGMAMAEQMLGSKFNSDAHTIVDNFTYTIAGDGCMMEGVTQEAASLAGHLKLGKLICFYDDNTVTIDGHTDLAFSEDVAKRFEAYGWHVQTVADGNTDLDAIGSAIEAAQKEGEKPSIIIVKTTIGFGAPNKGNTAGAHGSPLGDEELALARKELGWEHGPFEVPQSVVSRFESLQQGWKQAEADWEKTYEDYATKNPELAALWEQFHADELPEGYDADLPHFSVEEKMATRKSSGSVLQVLAKNIGNLVQGSADLHPSTNTYFKDSGDFQAGKRSGRNIHYGVREHAMGAIQNGIALYGTHIPLCSTFLVFADYMRPTIRLAAIMGIRSIFVFTHDSIGVGEDGPTHQPVEHAAVLRAIPNTVVLRPCDGNEVREAWKYALNRTTGPCCILLSRQGLPTLEGSQKVTMSDVERGAYILEETDSNPDLIMMGTGSEVHLLVEAKKKLEADGRSVRIVSIPSLDLFEAQPDSYREQILPSSVTARLACEAGIAQGWGPFIGAKGGIIAIDKFGASAPGGTVLKEYGFSADNVYEHAKKL